ncbi:spermidine/putrescine ABC transporter ATP-binding protein [Leifsonia sp. Root227]|uniref:ABC transporter ATP-binding protein n=1 Tax=Leifsonia sp. Root227 TaxID=1736496 RepID=UPI0006F3DC1C|nr:ABC transporter ATP-binding protein [Leifsonia sp. Root227]KRC49692.1 spermidine/putrescine ABC transporter ATP-binding protein [Leifsonia sp. Root227]
MTISPPETDGSVQLRGVTKLFGSQTAVDHIDLDVHSGEFISLLGPSGCGKTTLLRMIAGFEHPDAGDILVGGASVLNTPPFKRPVNTVFQSYALFPHMTVAENVAYGLRQKRVPRAEIAGRVRDALDMARMGGFADRSPQKLSGGQQQRVALARALVNRPRVLLLDEPMSALDRKLREEMQIELKLLQRQLGITFVFVTHDQQEALSMSDRIVVMQGGAVQQVGSTESVYLSPANAFVAGFIGKQNFLDATVQQDGVLLAADGPVGSAAGRQDAHAGDRVRVAVRAEAVTVVAERPETNAVRGTLAGISFLGDVIQYVVVTAAGVELLSRQAPGQAAHLSTGQDVWCGWEETEVHVFPADDAGTSPSASGTGAEAA